MELSLLLKTYQILDKKGKNNSPSSSVGISPAMGARNQVGIGLSYRTASLYETWLLNSRLGSWNRPIAGLKGTQD
jgi:hypothetical protein